jgi:hypothetical protein
MFGASWKWIGHSVVFVAASGALCLPGLVLFWHWKSNRIEGTAGFIAGLVGTGLLIHLLVSSSAAIRTASWMIRHRLITSAAVGIPVVVFVLVFSIANVERWNDAARITTRIAATALGGVGGIAIAAVLLVGLTWARRYEGPVGVNTTVPVVHLKITSYVALGDSYSAGEGLSPYLPGSGDKPLGDDCHRSAQGYPLRLRFAPAVPPVFRACSGAVSGDVYAFAQNPKLGVEVTPGLLGPNTGLVTLTMGGNDVHFSDVVKFCAETPHCLSPHVRFDPGSPSADEVGLAPAQPLEQWSTTMFKTVRGRLDRLFARLRHDAPHARIIVLGYPRLLPTGDVPRQFDSCDVVLDAIDRQERAGISGLEDQFNQVIYAATKSAHIEFLDTTNAFASHEACGVRGELINDLKITLQHGKFIIGVDRGAFHPRKEGQLVLARELSCYLNEYPTPPATNGSRSAPGTTDNPITCN